MTKSSRNGKNGFTLTEVMIAFAIFAMVMTSVFWAMIMAQRIGQSARNRMEALAENRAGIEELMSESYVSSELDVGTHSISRGGLQGSYTVTEPRVNETKRIVMTMNYLSFGRTASVELQTEISNALH